MSTTIKRVALVAVAALGLGVLTVAPSTAASNADTLTISSSTAAQTTAETATATSATTTLAFLAGGSQDTMSVTASLVSAPAGATALPYLQLVETASAQAGNGSTSILAAGTGSVSPNTAGLVWTLAANAAVSAKFKVYLGQGGATTAPTTVGTYVVKLTPAVVAGGGSLNAVAQTITITVTAAPTLDTTVSAAKSTAVLTSTSDTTTTTDATVTFVKTATLTNEAAYIKVVTNNAAGVSQAESYTAIVTSGPGLLGSGPLTNTYSGDARGRAITVKTGDVVTVYGDGTSGVSTVSIQTLAGATIATKTLTFFGAAASISTPTVVKTVIGTGGTTGVLTVSVKDAAGVNVSNLAGTLSVISDSATIASSVYAAGGTYDATTGLYTLGVTGNAAGIANIKVSTNATSTDTTGVSSAAVAVRVGSYTPASVKVTTDKSSYAPGEKATLSVQLFDANGLEVVTGETYTAIFAAGGITANYTVSGASTAVTSLVSYATGGKTFDVYLPVTEGDVKFSWTTGSTASGDHTGLATANQAVAGSVTVSVSSPSTSAAIDAANEAAQAASDATDAALAAADAADAATAAAQDAVDAVDALSKQVNKLIAALKAQITTLTNLVIKKLGK